MFIFNSLKEIILKLQQNVEQMERKRVHGSQFSRLNQPSVKKKKEITNEKREKKNRHKQCPRGIEKTVDLGKNQ